MIPSFENENVFEVIEQKFVNQKEEFIFNTNILKNICIFFQNIIEKSIPIEFKNAQNFVLAGFSPATVEKHKFEKKQERCLSYLKNFKKNPLMTELIEPNFLTELIEISSEQEEKRILELRNLIANFKNEDLIPIKIKKFGEEDRKLFKKEYTFFEALNNSLFTAFWKMLFKNIKDIEKLVKLKNKFDKDEDCFEEYSEHEDIVKKKIKEKSNNFFKDHVRQKTIHFEIYIRNYSFVIRAADFFDSEESKKGKHREINIRSEGMKGFLSILIFVNTIDYNDGEKKIIIFDEPDLHLHASAVLDVKEYLEKLIKKHKNLGIVIATHNPFFIDENNFLQMTLVKKTWEEGTKCFNKFASKTRKEDYSTLAPFLYTIGIDRKSFIELTNSKPVFVEGIQDMFLFNAMKYCFDDKYNDLLFIPFGGATKWPTLINTVTALTKQTPYFIFDNDKSGNDGLENIKKTSFYSENLKNAFFNNFKEYYDSNNSKKKHETQNLFTNETFEGEEISKNKKTMFYLRLWKAFKNENVDIKISETSKVKFENIFKRITKNLKNVD